MASQPLWTLDLRLLIRFFLSHSFVLIVPTLEYKSFAQIDVTGGLNNATSLRLLEVDVGCRICRDGAGGPGQLSHLYTWSRYPLPKP